MNILPVHLLDLSQIDSINVLGRGGKERSISLLLPKWKRSNSALYDYEIDYEGKSLKLEIKKQANEQWFDSGKYYLLSEIDRDIIMLFVNHFQGRIDTIAAIKLGEFIDLLLSTSQYHAHGWAEEVMSIAADLKKEYPSLQFKAKARIGNMLRDHRQYFQIVFERC